MEIAITYKDLAMTSPSCADTGRGISSSGRARESRPRRRREGKWIYSRPLSVVRTSNKVTAASAIVPNAVHFAQSVASNTSTLARLTALGDGSSD
jgi:hypothetical protein